MEQTIKLKIASETSDGGFISFDLAGINGQVSIEIKSISNGSPRTDVRVNHKDLRKVLRMLEAMLVNE